MRRKYDRRQYPRQPIVKPAVGTFVVRSASVDHPVQVYDGGSSWASSVTGLTSVTLKLESSGPVNAEALYGALFVVVRPA